MKRKPFVRSEKVVELGALVGAVACGTYAAVDAVRSEHGFGLAALFFVLARLCYANIRFEA